MNKTLTLSIVALTIGLALAATAAPKGKTQGKSKISQETRAVIVVTGMRLDENPANYRKDLAVAQGATVTVTADDGQVRTKNTETFARSGKQGAEAHFTADFPVDLDTTYTIEMTFRNGTKIRVKDYRIPQDWRTHFYFHSTNGSVSPSSVLRFEEDPQTKLRCCLYAVFPLENYHKLGGTQIQ
jgi:hypothetical protein